MFQHVRVCMQQYNVYYKDICMHVRVTKDTYTSESKYKRNDTSFMSSDDQKHHVLESAIKSKHHVLESVIKSDCN